MVKIINTLVFVLCLLTIITSHTALGMFNDLKKELDLKRQLYLINKSPIKSIKTKSGYIVDCIDINKQPAFDHPLLKNHKLQTKPSFEEKNSETSANISQTKIFNAFEKVKCPKGTVPIRRTTKDDLIRINSEFALCPPQNQNQIVTHNAYGSSVRKPGPYYGVKGHTSIYNPQVSDGQSSGGNLYVQNGFQEGTNKISVGWHVSPRLYNDHRTYLYTQWTSDNNMKTGCYNMLCEGFVQTDTSYYIGGPISTTSTIGGNIFELPLYLAQDQQSKNWWLKIVDKNIGYFPAALFSNLSQAEEVGWGGFIETPICSQGPPMGSGEFPSNDFEHGAYFRFILLQDIDREYTVPKFVHTSSDVNCYGVEYYGRQDGVDYALQFGGPGGCY